jgi:hypothetical protein
MITAKLSDKPCCLCGARNDTLEVRFKDKTFTGVLCAKHQLELMKRNAASKAALEPSANGRQIGRTPVT